MGYTLTAIIYWPTIAGFGAMDPTQFSMPNQRLRSMLHTAAGDADNLEALEPGPETRFLPELDIHPGFQSIQFLHVPSPCNFLNYLDQKGG